MKIGYIRVSKQEQNEALQRDALKEAGCEKYFSDKVTGAKFERKGLEELLAFVRPDDTVVVWKLDRLGQEHRDPLIRPQNYAEISRRILGFIIPTDSFGLFTPEGEVVKDHPDTHDQPQDSEREASRAITSGKEACDAIQVEEGKSEHDDDQKASYSCKEHRC